MSMFSKNLHKALSQRSIKQVDFATVLEVPPTTVSGWIRGAHEPSIDMLLKVCSYLNIPVGEMVGDSNHYVDRMENFAKAEDKVKDLSDKLRVATAEIAKYKEIAYRAEEELEAVKRSGNRYRNLVDTLKADGASKITIEF